MTLLQLASGSWIGQAVHVAAKLGIADLLEDGPRSPATLAEATSTHAGTLHRLLRALASLGVFAEDTDGCFALTLLAEGLRTNAPGSLRA
jgi:DNA-binding IclR family transcriptional regulator